MEGNNASQCRYLPRMRELRPETKLLGKAEDVVASPLEIKVLAGKRPPLLYGALLCRIAKRPKVNGLPTNQEVGPTLVVPLGQNLAEFSKGKAHKR